LYEKRSKYHKRKIERSYNCTGASGRLLLYQKLIDYLINLIQYPKEKQPKPTVLDKPNSVHRKLCPIILSVKTKSENPVSVNFSFFVQYPLEGPFAIQYQP
jgi:hypothetical protein